MRDATIADAPCAFGYFKVSYLEVSYLEVTQLSSMIAVHGYQFMIHNSVRSNHNDCRTHMRFNV